MYHIDMVWDEIGYFQIGDEPGRCEPGTGEINYKNIFKHIYQKSSKGIPTEKANNKNFILGMEHFNSIDGIEGEKALLKAKSMTDGSVSRQAAARACNDFAQAVEKKGQRDPCR